MYCIYQMTIACLKMFVRNKQALFFSLIMPMMILLIFGSMNFDKRPKLTIGLVTHSPNLPTGEFVKQLKSFDALVVDSGTLESETARLKSGDRIAVVVVPDDLLNLGPAKNPHEMLVYANEGRPMEVQILMSILNTFRDRASMKIAGLEPAFAIEQQKTAVHNFRYIEFLVPGVIAMAVMQMAVFSVAFVFAQYREKGILKRLMATPMRPYQFVTANVITRLIVSVIQAYIFVVTGLAVYHVHVAGSYVPLTVCIILGSLAFLGLGFTVSGLSKTIETVPVLANIIVFPMLFLGSVFFAATNMPAWLQPIADGLPLSYLSKSLRGIMTDGLGFAQLKGQFIGLSVWAAILLTLATVTFRFQTRDNM